MIPDRPGERSGNLYCGKNYSGCFFSPGGVFPGLLGACPLAFGACPPGAGGSRATHGRTGGSRSMAPGPVAPGLPRPDRWLQEHDRQDRWLQDVLASRAWRFQGLSQPGRWLREYDCQDRWFPEYSPQDRRFQDLWTAGPVAPGVCRLVPVVPGYRRQGRWFQEYGRQDQWFREYARQDRWFQEYGLQDRWFHGYTRQSLGFQDRSRRTGCSAEYGRQGRWLRDGRHGIPGSNLPPGRDGGHYKNSGHNADQHGARGNRDIFVQKSARTADSVDTRPDTAAHTR